MTGIVIPDGGNIGSASDTDAIAISSTGKVTTADSELNVKAVNGSTTHTFTVKGIGESIGDSQSGTAPDTTDSDSGQFAVYTGSTKLFGITEHGYVLKPNNPCFFAKRQASMTGSAHGTIVFESTASPGMNVGNHYSTSTGYFTAPVAGLYYFSWGMFKDNSSSVARADLKINGTSFVQGRMAEGDFYDNAYLGITSSLSAGDYVYVDNSDGFVWSGNALGPNQPYFCGFLIG
jgi:hypothetical protein